MIKAAIFDYGGTLVQPKAPWVDVRPRAVSASYTTLAHSGLQMPREEFAAFNEAFFGEYSKREELENRDIPDVVKYHDLMDRLFPTRPRAWRRRVAGQANDAFWHVVVANYVPKMGARRSLSELESMGIKMAVASNHHNHQALVEHLDRLGLGGYFRCILSSDQLGARKPDQKIFRECLSKLRVGAEDTVFVGDSVENDVAGASGCGILSILIEDEAVRDAGRFRAGRETESLAVMPAADFTVRRLGEIPRIVGRLNAAEKSLG